jgi:predicted transcriptional regulator
MRQHASRKATALTVPDDLDSPRSKLCYTYLAVSGPSTVGELTGALGLRRLELFPLLETLREREWVTRKGEHYALVGS